MENENGDSNKTKNVFTLDITLIKSKQTEMA
jgi:hypothetical protein